MGFDANTINPFLESTKNTIAMVAQMDLTVGKPSLKPLAYGEDYLRIIIGIIGEMQGHAIIAIPETIAKQIASAMMMGMPVEDFDSIALSAISELGNMIMGGTATLLAERNIKTDITPPIMERGSSTMQTKECQNICVPFTLDGKTVVELNIMVRKAS